MMRLTSPSTPAQYAPPCLPSRVSASTHCSANARFASAARSGEKPANASRTRSVAPVHGIVVGAADRREQVPPRQPAVVTEQPRLRAQVAAEVGQRRDDRVGHRVERGAVDVVRAQRGLEVVGETAPAVQHAELALGAVERGRERHRDGRPRLELAFVRGAAARRIGMGREPAGERHRHALGRAAGIAHLDRQLRRDVTVEPLPRERPRRRELAGERLLLLAHLELGALGAPCATRTRARRPPGCAR